MTKSTAIDALGASPALAVTVTAQELGVVVDLAANANAPVGRVLQLGDLFQRLVRLANSTHPIGEIVPAPTAPEPTYADKHRIPYRDPKGPGRLADVVAASYEPDTTFPA